MKFLRKSNVIGAVFPGIYALSFLVGRPRSLGSFDLGAMALWIAAAWMVMKRPGGFGLPVAILVFCSISLQLHFLRSSLAKYTEGTDIQVSPKLWVNFWISVLPLILGGLFAAFAFWISGRKASQGKQTKPDLEWIDPKSP